MPDKTVVIGDPVLWYGFELEVTGLDTAENGQLLAVVEETAKQAARDEAMAHIKELRATQAECSAQLRAAFDTIKSIEALPAKEKHAKEKHGKEKGIRPTDRPNDRVVFKEPLVEHFDTKLTPISVIFSIAIGACWAIFRAHDRAVSNSSWSGTTWLTSP